MDVEAVVGEPPAQDGLGGLAQGGRGQEGRGGGARVGGRVGGEQGRSEGGHDGGGGGGGVVVPGAVERLFKQSLPVSPTHVLSSTHTLFLILSRLTVELGDRQMTSQYWCCKTADESAFFRRPGCYTDDIKVIEGMK